MDQDLDTCGFLCVHEDIVTQVQASLPDDDTLSRLADLFKVFGDGTRIRILYVLFESEVCVCDLARLLGVRSSRMLTLGWALSSAVGALAALLIIPTELGLNPHAVDTVFVYAFTVAVVGGLDSAPGAVAGGLAVGVVLSWVSGYLGATLAPIAVLVLLLAVLLLRPAGLFSMTKERTV